MASESQTDLVKRLMKETSAFSRKQRKPIKRGSSEDQRLKEFLKDLPSDIKVGYDKLTKAGVKGIGKLRHLAVRAAFKRATKAKESMSKEEAHDIMRAILHSIDSEFALPRDSGRVNAQLPYLMASEMQARADAEKRIAAEVGAAGREEAAEERVVQRKAAEAERVVKREAATEKARDAIAERARRKKAQAEAKAAEKQELVQKNKDAVLRQKALREEAARERREAAQRSRRVRTQQINKARMAQVMREQEAKAAIEADRGRVVFGPDLSLSQRALVPPTRAVAPLGVGSGPSDMTARGPSQPPRRKKRKRRRKRKRPEESVEDDIKEVAADANVPADTVRDAQSRGLDGAAAAAVLGLGVGAAALGTAAYRRLFPSQQETPDELRDLEEGLPPDDGRDNGDDDGEDEDDDKEDDAEQPDDEPVAADWKDALNAYFSLKRETPRMDRKQKAELKKRVAKLEGANPQLVEEINSRIPGFINDRLTSLRGHQFAGPGTDMSKIMAITADPVTKPDSIPSFIPINSLDMATLRHDIYYSFGSPYMIRLADALGMRDVFIHPAGYANRSARAIGQCTAKPGATMAGSLIVFMNDAFWFRIRHGGALFHVEASVQHI